MESPQISIIVPVYNVEKYLCQCLDSLVNQTMRDIEIICINDGSTDGSLKILREYEINDSRIRIIDQRNGGLSSARNAGLKKVIGEYVMFVDSDDWLDICTCEEIYNIASKENADSVMFSYTKEFGKHSVINHIMPFDFKIFEENNFIKSFYQKLIGPIDEDLLHPENLDLYVSACMQLFRFDMIKDIEFVDTKKIGTEDLLYQLNVYKNCSRFIYVDKPYYHYRRSEYGTLTTSYMPDKYNRWVNLFNLISKTIDANNNSMYRRALHNRIAVTSLGLGLNEICSNDNIYQKAKRMKKILNSSPYKESLDDFRLNALPFHWKVYFLLCKKKMTIPLVLLLNIIEFLRRNIK